MNIDIVCKIFFGKDLYFAGKILLCKCIFFAAILSYSQSKLLRGMDYWLNCTVYGSQFLMDVMQNVFNKQ